MWERKEKSENRMFILFVVLAVVFGAGMLLWGQYNSAQQAFEIGFLNYRVDEQLAADKNYALLPEEEEQYAAMLAEAEAWSDGVGGEEKSCTAATAVELYGDMALGEIAYTLYDNGSDTTVILLHGYNESGMDARMFAPYWWERGYNVLIPELWRKEGDIKLTTFGVYEQYDVYDVIQAEGLADDRLILHGRGTGAATALLLSANEAYDCGVDLVVADSVYSDLQSLKVKMLKSQFGLGELLVGKLLSNTAASTLGFDLTTVNIAEAAGATEIPKFFVCGAIDHFLGSEETEAVYQAADGACELLVVEGARHRMAYTKSAFDEADPYRSGLDKFVDMNMTWTESREENR